MHRLTQEVVWRAVTAGGRGGHGGSMLAPSRVVACACAVAASAWQTPALASAARTHGVGSIGVTTFGAEVLGRWLCTHVAAFVDSEGRAGKEVARVERAIVASQRGGSQLSTGVGRVWADTVMSSLLVLASEACQHGHREVDVAGRTRVARLLCS